MKRNINYGLGHSKKYKPTIVSEFTCDRDDDGKVLKVHSDVYLLLRQENLSKRIGTNAIRDYIDSLMCQTSVTPQLTDDELFSMIEPKYIDNLTDAHKYAKFIEANSKDIQKRYKNLLERYNNRYNKNSSTNVKLKDLD